MWVLKNRGFNQSTIVPRNDLHLALGSLIRVASPPIWIDKVAKIEVEMSNGCEIREYWTYKT